MPFEIPSLWEWTTINDISKSILYGVSESAKTNGKYRLLRITDIQNNSVQWDSVPYTDFDENKAKSYLLSDGDILFARTGATVGKSYLVQGLTEGAIYASYLIRVQTYDAVLPQYLKFYFESGYYWEQIKQGSVGVGQPNVNGTILGNLHVPIPPLHEQFRIVSELSKWMGIIDIIENSQTDLQALIKQTKSKILDLAIHGKLVPQDPNDEPASELIEHINPKAEITCDNGHSGKLPQGWEWTTLGELYNIISAKRVLKSEWRNEGIPFYRAREIVKLSTTGFVDNELFISQEHYSDLKMKYGVPQSSDIMMSAVGSIGKTYIVKSSDLFYYKDASVICLQNVHGLYSVFIDYVLRTSFLQKQMYTNSKGTTVDTITIEKAREYNIPLPPLAEQQRIVTKIEELFSVLDNIQNALEA